MKKTCLWALVGLILFSSVLLFPLSVRAHDVNECYRDHQACRERALAMDGAWTKIAIYLTVCDVALGKCILGIVEATGGGPSAAEGPLSPPEARGGNSHEPALEASPFLPGPDVRHPAGRGRRPGRSPVRRLAAEDVTSRAARPDEASLGLAAALAFDAERVYAADAEDCAVKVFRKSGRFEAALGRSGHGPGEFSFPSGVAVLGGRLFVADKLNRRIQVLDLSGRFLRSFALPFAPDRVLVLAADRLLVTRRPSSRPAGEKILHFFSASGEPLRQELVARAAGDPVLDAFLNMVLVNPGPRGDLFVVFKCQERAVLHYGPDGGLDERVAVDPRYGLQGPVAAGPQRAEDGRGLLLGERPGPGTAVPPRARVHGRRGHRARGQGLRPRRRPDVSKPGSTCRPASRAWPSRGTGSTPSTSPASSGSSGWRDERTADGARPPGRARGRAGLSAGRGRGPDLPDARRGRAAGAGAALLVFFSTECPVCYDGLFESRLLVEKGGWPVRVVGVASGPADDLRSFLEKFGWTLPVVHDRRKSLARRFGVDVVPDWVLVVGGEPVCRNDQRAGPVRGMEGLAACLRKDVFPLTARLAGLRLRTSGLAWPWPRPCRSSSSSWA